VRAPSRVGAAWRRLRELPLLVQLAAWVLLLPVVASVAVWQLGWPKLARMAVVAGIAVWNLLVFLPAA
jgi:membrane protein YdbS with pleckstrin-like domain